MIGKWDRYFLRVARESALMSKDPSSQIGAVVVKDRRIVSAGFNGFPPGIADDDRLHDREQKLRLVVHAEMNALLRAGPEAQGATLYMWGFRSAPCDVCTKHALALGIVRVVGGGSAAPERWKTNLEESERTLREAGVEFVAYGLSDVVGGPTRTHQEREG